MQCFICMTYMFFICSVSSRRDTPQEERSLFHDVIESLKIRAQLPEDTNQNDENNLAQIYDRYGYENDELHLPNDAEFTPRRNDRLELPPLKYRLPKMLAINGTESIEKSKNSSESKEEIVIFISTTEVPKVSTNKVSKKPSRQPNKKPNFGEDLRNKTLKIPIVNTMADQSHIGDKKIHMILTPQIVFNFGSSEDNKKSMIEVEDREYPSNRTPSFIPQNIFNIHQEIKLDKEIINSDPIKDNDLNRVRQDIKVSRNEKSRAEKNVIMREIPEKYNRTERKTKNVLQILLSL